MRSEYPDNFLLIAWILYRKSRGIHFVFVNNCPQYNKDYYE
ncbi:hypothetical protein [Emticicia agri]|nr:hypothetical protein [Emticicia agri]